MARIKKQVRWWHLGESIALIRQLESIAVEYGFHVGLGGGVLHHGCSKKDLDVIVMPHKTLAISYPALFREELEFRFGIKKWKRRDHKAVGDEKNVWMSMLDGRRIDFFFLS